MKRCLFCPLVLLLCGFLVGLPKASPAAEPSRPETVAIGSKAFPESWILGEALKRLAESAGAEAIHRDNLGGTEIVYQALRAGNIDVYPEYTGTVAEVLMKAEGRPSMDEMRSFLKQQGIGMTNTLGFNDGYALAVMPETQEKYGLYKISDLAKHPDLRLAFTHEFVGRKDGWAGLSRHYGLRMNNVRGIQHELAYTAIESGQIDVMEIYTTDAQIARIGLKMLEDDRDFFPRYDAVLLYRLELPDHAPQAFEAMTRLIGTISEEEMIRANAAVVLDKKPTQAAAALLIDTALGEENPTDPSSPVVVPSRGGELARDLIRHLQLVSLSLLASILVGIPLGVLATRSRLLASLTLSGTGLLQTIPSLALLAMLIPLFGIGLIPALIALFLYSLLPIVRNTYTGLATIPPALSESAEALGMSAGAQLLRVKLPMASPAILAGVKTSAVINVGTATLAALIGAGGLGNPILQGISLRDTSLILQGAIPAALLAVAVQFAFDLLDRVLIPKGLRLPESR